MTTNYVESAVYILNTFLTKPLRCILLPLLIVLTCRQSIYRLYLVEYCSSFLVKPATCFLARRVNNYAYFYQVLPTKAQSFFFM